MIPKNNQPREYHTRIDFSREHKNWGLRGFIMIHVDKSKLIDFTEKLMSLGILNSWELRIRPSFSGLTNHCIILNCRSSIQDDVDTTLKNLLNLLETFKINIIYKEGEFGYKINATGVIYEKWLLDDGGC